MFGWLASKNKARADDSSSTQLREFLDEYQNSDKRDRYAMALWGIVTAFNKIFGDLDGFQSAPQERRSRYIQIIGSNAVQHVRDGELISASCENFFLNYVVATNGLRRSDLRGEIEQVADMIDGIVRRGALKMDQVGAMEEAARAYVAEEAPFAIGTGVVKGAVTERAVGEVSAIVLHDLQQLLRTKEDYYFFLIEQHELLVSQKSSIRTMLDGLPLFPIEYESVRAADSHIEKRRSNSGVRYIASILPAIRKWCATTVPALDPDELATRVATAAYGHFRMSFKQALDAVRLEYAVQYRDSCVASGNHQMASEWSAVIESLS